MTFTPLTDDLPAFSMSQGLMKKACRWVVILAGGEGRRMRPLIQAWLGEDRPKQYCTFTGSRSMIQHTLDRALQLVEPEHIVTVTCRGHLDWLAEAVDRIMPGVVI